LKIKRSKAEEDLCRDGNVVDGCALLAVVAPGDCVEEHVTDERGRSTTFNRRAR
jgi:hypothetical protein